MPDLYAYQNIPPRACEKAAVRFPLKGQHVKYQGEPCMVGFAFEPEKYLFSLQQLNSLSLIILIKDLGPTSSRY